MPILSQADATVGRNLKHQRGRAGLTLQELAQRSGVSRSMLGQVELGQATPTINTLWRVSHALALPFSTLARPSPPEGASIQHSDEGAVFTSRDGRFVSRLLLPADALERREIYELTLAFQGHEQSQAHAAGTVESLVVNRGRVEITVGGETFELGRGDAIRFTADVPHAYRNIGREDVVMTLIVSYAPGTRV